MPLSILTGFNENGDRGGGGGGGIIFCRGDGGDIALIMACIGGGGGIGIVFVILGVGGGGDGAGGGDENVLCIGMGEGGGGGVGILETSINFVDDDGIVLPPSRTDSAASVNGDGGGGGGGIKDVVIEVDLFFKFASGGSGGVRYVKSSLGAFACLLCDKHDRSTLSIEVEATRVILA